MRILLTGGTGAAGASALRATVAAGLEVVAAVRSQLAADAVKAAGATPLIGNLADAEWIRGELTQADGAIHAAGGPLGAAEDFEPVIVDAAIEAFWDTDKPFVSSGGMLSYAAGHAISETSPYDPVPSMVERAPLEDRLLASGIRSSVVQPARVYGRDDRLARLLAAGYNPDTKELKLPGTGEQHWPTVHADDLGALYLTVLKQAPGGQRYIAASPQSPSVRELSAALAGPGINLVPEGIEETQVRFGAAAELALRDQKAAVPTSATKLFGWTTKGTSLVELLATQYRPQLAELASAPPF